KGATLFGADFNVVSDSQDGHRLARAFKGAGLTDAFTAAGIMPGDKLRNSLPRGHDIDRIFASDQFQVEDVHVVHEPGEIASDHLPVVASYTLSGAQQPHPHALAEFSAAYDLDLPPNRA
ncbi:MAG: hypothetical protein H7123_07235, partial [Thermoleophilia bacterium]|nr:hypothetical protein [Thermoleophilia bacterium]